MLPFQQQPEIAFGESLSKEKAIKLNLCLMWLSNHFYHREQYIKKMLIMFFHSVLHLVFQNEQVNNSTNLYNNFEQSKTFL